MPNQTFTNYLKKLLYLQIVFLFMPSLLLAQEISTSETQVKRFFAQKDYITFDPPIKIDMKERMWERVGKYIEKNPTVAEFNQKEPYAECPSMYGQCYLDVDLDTPQSLLNWNYYFISEDVVKKAKAVGLKGRLDFNMRGVFPKLNWLSNPRVSGSMKVRNSEGIKQGGFIIASKQTLNITSKDVTDKASFNNGLLNYTPLEGLTLKGKPYEVSKFMKPKKAIEFKAGENSYLLVKWMGFDSPCMFYSEVFKIEGKQLTEVVRDISGCDI